MLRPEDACVTLPIALSPSGRRAWRSAVLVPTIYLLVGFAAYARILTTYFVADDFAYLHDIAAAQSPSIIVSALAARYFRPMVVLVYYVNYQLSGLHPFSYHASVVLLNVVNASLVFFLGRALSAPPLVAPLAGFLFLVFGGHSEAITWIGGMADPLVTMCVLTAILLFMAALRDARPMRWIIAVWVTFFAALLSKESAAILPGILVAVAVLAAAEEARDRRWRVLAITLAGMVAVGAAYLILRTSVLGFTFVRLEGLGTNRHVIAMTRAFLIRSCLPHGGVALAVFMRRFDLLVGVPLVVMVLWGRTRNAIKPLVLIGLCLAMALAPVLPLSISLVDTQSERLIYMASAFAMLGLVWLVALATQQKRALIAVVAILAVANLVMLSDSNHNWREASGLTEQALPSFAEAIRTHKLTGRPVFVVNLPDNVRGAYVFRRGFPEALRLAAPDSRAALTEVGILSVYSVADTSQAVRVTIAGSRSLNVHLGGGWLLGSAAQPTVWVALRDWSTQSFGIDFTPMAAGSLILYFTPQKIEVVSGLF